MPKQKHGATLKAPVNSGKIEIVSNRVKTPGDLEQIVELDFKTFSVPSGLPTIEIARKALSPWLDNPGTGLVTAYVDDHVVGYCLHCIIPFSEIKDYEQAASAKGLKIDKRGRVMSFYSMAFLGMAMFGNLLVGSLANSLGVCHKKGKFPKQGPGGNRRNCSRPAADRHG